MSVKPLEPPDSHHLKAAQGWLGLGNWREANEELEKLAPQFRAHPDVLLCRYGIYSKAKNWNGAVVIAKTLTEQFPDKSFTWIGLAYSTRRKTGRSIQQAKEILLAVEPKFPREHLFPFNLACYCSQLGQLNDAEMWLKKAMAIDEKTVQKKEMEDDDLKPLWDSMSGHLWKKE